MPTNSMSAAEMAGFKTLLRTSITGLSATGSKLMILFVRIFSYYYVHPWLLGGTTTFANLPNGREFMSKD